MPSTNSSFCSFCWLKSSYSENHNYVANWPCPFVQYDTVCSSRPDFIPWRCSQVNAAYKYKCAIIAYVNSSQASTHSYGHKHVNMDYLVHPCFSRHPLSFFISCSFLLHSKWHMRHYTLPIILQNYSASSFSIFIHTRPMPFLPSAILINHKIHFQFGLFLSQRPLHHSSFNSTRPWRLSQSFRT